MKPSTYKAAITKWAFPLLLIGVALLWGYFEALAFMDIRGRMAGFALSVILAIPAAGLFCLAMIAWALRQKSAAIGCCSLLPVLILALPIFFAYQLGIYGWSNEIGVHSEINEAAIMRTDFTGAQFEEVPYKDHERMVEVTGFKWSNADGMIAAKNGSFYGFVVDSVPHVYISPLMNGARGVAWVTDTSKINGDPTVRYEYTGVAKWFVWTLAV